MIPQFSLSQILFGNLAPAGESVMPGHGHELWLAFCQISDSAIVLGFLMGVFFAVLARWCLGVFVSIPVVSRLRFLHDRWMHSLIQRRRKGGHHAD